MRIKVELLGHLHEVTGAKELEVEFAPPTVAGLIERLSNTYGETFNRWIVSSDSEEYKVMILVNGIDIDFLRKSMTTLASGDEVIMIPLVTGG